MIKFDFIATLNENTINLHSTDVYVFQDENGATPPVSYDYIYNMHNGYLVKENGIWILCMPDLNYD